MSDGLTEKLRVFFGCLGRPAVVAVVEHDVPFWLLHAVEGPSYDEGEGEDIRHFEEGDR